MKSPQSIALLFFSYSMVCFGQSDTIIVYTPSTQQMDTILPVEYDMTLTLGHTGSNEGGLPGTAILNNSIPMVDLMSGVNHTMIGWANEWFNVGDYPVRATIKLAREAGDSLDHVCSGMMVSRTFVLTASHCVLDFQSGTFFEGGILAFPGYDQGEENPTVPSSAVERVYVFNRNVGGTTQSGYDIALLELADPIGEQTGWVGIGFESDDFIENNIFHKFSYPGQPLPNDTVGLYNGDTIYYDYGEIEVLSNFLGIQSSDAFGIPGQSGSSFFVENGSDLFSVGVLAWSNAYRHTRITNNIYHQFKPLLDNDQQVASIQHDDFDDFRIYPNPTDGQVTINLSQFYDNIDLSIKSALGQEVLSTTLRNAHQFDLSVPWESGVYIIELTSNENREVFRVVKR